LLEVRSDGRVIFTRDNRFATYFPSARPRRDPWRPKRSTRPPRISSSRSHSRSSCDSENSCGSRPAFSAPRRSPSPWSASWPLAAWKASNRVFSRPSRAHVSSDSRRFFISARTLSDCSLTGDEALLRDALRDGQRERGVDSRGDAPVDSLAEGPAAYHPETP